MRLQFVEPMDRVAVRERLVCGISFCYFFALVGREFKCHLSALATNRGGYGKNRVFLKSTGVKAAYIGVFSSKSRYQKYQNLFSLVEVEWSCGSPKIELHSRF